MSTLRERTQSESELFNRFNEIQKVHSIGVIIYWICTISMMIEGFFLFIKAVTPEGLDFPKEYELLRVQEIC